MDSDKRSEQRRHRCSCSRRMQITRLLGANYLKLGAGVSIFISSWGGVSGFAVAEETQESVQTTSRAPASEIRLKSMGSTISFTPINRPIDAVSRTKVSQHHLSKIQLDPMTGGTNRVFDQPVVVAAEPASVDQVAASQHEPIADDMNTWQDESAGETNEVRRDLAEVDSNLATHSNHPRILSIRRMDNPNMGRSAQPTDELAPVADVPQPKTVVAAPPGSGMPPSILVESLEIKVESEAVEASSSVVSGAANVSTTEADPIASLPLLPIPNRQWVAAETSETVAPVSGMQRRQRVPLSAPPSISVAQVNRLSTMHPTTTVRARPAGYVRPAEAADRMPEKVTRSLDATALMMKAIRDRYPDAHVVLANSDNQLVAQGSCRDRKQATAIMRLIRSQLLIPVDDQLVVR
ncbi:hypothetical protein Poly21_12930 [Allorhodopirellula heiligendammensis]|uniref:Uncharacterized protein n=2 Tax=Allorhodopirellula heiligendammensis TaxID=2714739 RepID=A0A5C6C4U8_9BACT|nr:hypothetical protein Poly21_12930 [Allorhodopirellula heiligendammensis]